MIFSRPIFRNFILSIVITFAQLFAAHAQWNVYNAPEFGGGSIRSLHEHLCGTTRLLFAGTTNGIFLNPSGQPASGFWLNVSGNLPANREIAGIASVDSLLFIALRSNGVYYSVISTSGNVSPQCRPTTWSQFGSNAIFPFTNSIAIQDTIAFVGTDQGVYWASLRRSSTASLSKIASSNTWTSSNGFGQQTLVVAGSRTKVLAGTFLRGVYSAEMSCITSSTSSVALSCEWTQSTTSPQFINTSTYDITTVNFPSSFYKTSPKDSIPCTGILFSTGRGSNLFFSYADTISRPLDQWHDVSPYKTQPQLDWKINKIIARSFPGAANSIIVGTEFGGLWMSQDCGQTWAQINFTAQNSTELAGSDVRALTVIRDSLLVAGADASAPFTNGVFAQASARSLVKNRPTGVWEWYSEFEKDSLRREAKLTIYQNQRDERYEIGLELRDRQYIEISVVNLLGRRVYEVYKGEAPSGQSRYFFSETALPPGMYFCVVQSNRFKIAEKLVISK